MHRIVNTGRGVFFTSHMKEETVRPKGGEKFTRIYPSMGNQARNVIEAFVDMFFFVEYVRVKNDVIRVIVTEGDDMIWAGCREMLGFEFPRFLPLTRKGGHDILLAASKGEDVGLDPTTMMPTNAANPTLRQFLNTARAKAMSASISNR
jgi:hypothetical protein